MANEVIYGVGGTRTNLRAQEVFNALLWETLVDRTDLRATMIRLGDVGGSGSDTLTTPTVDFSTPMAAAAANEVDAAGNSALSSSSVSLAVAHQILAYGLTDKFMITAGQGNLAMQQLAASMAEAYVLRVTDLVCTAAESFTSDVTAATTMDVDAFMSGIAQLEQSSVPGPYSCVLHNKQWTQLQSKLRAESSSTIAFAPATYEQIAARAPGYQGQLLGVDLYSCDSVSATASHYNGSIFGLGALAYVEASPRQAMPGSVAALVTPAGSPVYAEFDRQGDPGISRVIGHAFCQVGILEDARGAGLLSDA